MKPTYDATTHRWFLFEINPFSNSTPFHDYFYKRVDDVFFGIGQELNSRVMKRPDNSFYELKAVRHRFLVDRQIEAYEGFNYLVFVNDPINALSDPRPSSFDDAVDEAVNIIGNYRIGFKRLVLHAGETADQRQTDHLSLLPPSFLPYPSDSRVALHTPTGLHFLLRENEGDNTNTIFLIANSLNMIINDDADSTLVRKVSKDDVNIDVDKVRMKSSEELLNEWLSNGVGGSVDGQPRTLSFLNAKAQSLVLSNDSLQFIGVIDSDYSTRVGGVEITANPSDSNAHGKTRLFAGQTEVLIEKDGNVTVTAGSTTVVVNKDGDVEITANSKVVINGDLEVSGSATINNGSTINGDLTVNGDSDLNGNLDVQGITNHGA